MTGIPKIFHRIWLGPDPLPEEFSRYGESWLKFHPGWEMKHWTEENLPEDLELWDYVVGSHSFANKSNILRYEILHRYGGVYLDTDFVCQKSIEPLLREDVSAFAAYQTEGPEEIGAINCAIVGAVPEHPFLRAAMDAIPQWFGPTLLPCVLGPQLFTVEARKRSDVTIFPKWMFYPYRWDEPGRKNEPFPDSYAVHHWSSNWIHGLDVKVFGVGLSRTGTLSLNAALEILGYKSAHFPHSLDILDKGVNAATDITVSCEFKALDKRYPKSKFVLTTRPVEDWLKSMKWLIENGFYLPPTPSGSPPPLTGTIRRACMRTYGTTTYDEALLRSAYDRHHREVVRHFDGRPEDLLVMDVTSGDGWGRLCPFLGKPAPDRPFPHLHERGR